MCINCGRSVGNFWIACISYSCINYEKKYSFVHFQETVAWNPGVRFPLNLQLHKSNEKSVQTKLFTVFTVSVALDKFNAFFSAAPIKSTHKKKSQLWSQSETIVIVAPSDFLVSFSCQMFCSWGCYWLLAFLFRIRNFTRQNCFIITQVDCDDETITPNCYAVFNTWIVKKTFFSVFL